MNNDIFHNPENEIQERINNMPEKINCAKVGKILSVNENGTAAVDIDGLALNCLLFCIAGANAFIDFEDYKDTMCLVIFCDDDLTKFKTQNKTLKDIDARKHTLNNGIALSGVFPFGKRPKGSNHFVSFEQLDDILGEWSQNLLNSLNSIVATGAAALVPPPAPPPPVTFLVPLPDAINISDSKIGGITHHD